MTQIEELRKELNEIFEMAYATSDKNEKRLNSLKERSQKIVSEVCEIGVLNREKADKHKAWLSNMGDYILKAFGEFDKDYENENTPT